MTTTEDRDPLREGFQALADVPPEGRAENTSAIEPDLVWRAVTGELPPSERREVVARLAEDPDAAESWRLAHEMEVARLALGRDATPRQLVDSVAWRRWVAVAAALLALAVIAPLVLRQLGPETDPVYRDAARWTVATELPDGATVPRIAPHLSWHLDGPPAELDTSELRYTLRVLLPDLTPIVTVRDLAASDYALDPVILQDLPPGQELLWQVDAHLPDGAVLTSPTFVATLQ